MIILDVESAINLELVSSQGPQRSHNLFSSLDRCVTPMGRRLLRSSLLQPLCNRDAILERQTCISELVHNRNLHTLLQVEIEIKRFKISKIRFLIRNNFFFLANYKTTFWC